LAFTLSLAASASTWFYVNYILRAQQIADASAHSVPRGNLSDLYPRWLGARELLRHGHSPYSPEITREIQQGYYGRPLDPKRPNDPKDRQGFAYPVYVVFLLAPTIGMPFEEVQTGFRWLLITLAALSVLLWLRVLRWKASCGTTLIFIVLMLGWLPMVQGIKLQQLSLLVAGLLAGCSACVAGGWLSCAGMLLALSTIKPQLAWPCVLWLFVWASADWRSRRRLVISFGVALALLIGGAELLLPGWPRMFIHAIGEYHRYTQNESVLVWLFGTIAGRLFEAVCTLACAVCVWRVRREPATSTAFGGATSLVLALTVVVVPMFAPYNQVLLVPAILALVWSRSRRASIVPWARLAIAAGGALLVWPWIATMGLSAASVWLTPDLRQKLLFIPFRFNFELPIVVFALALLESWPAKSRNLRRGAAQRKSSLLQQKLPR
jgi:hypothetical protein